MRLRHFEDKRKPNNFDAKNYNNGCAVN